jgi:Domain of unknown function (DUF4112)
MSIGAVIEASYTRWMQRSVSGEIFGASRAERFAAAERRIGRVTHVLDELVTVPGTGFRVGLDPIVGLIPIVGDAVAGVVGIWVIAEAAQFGIPRIVLGRMVVNLLVDLAVGAIPLLGDLFDFVIRSNSRNLALFRRHALDPDASTRGEQAFFVGLFLLLVGLIWLTVMAVGAVWEFLTTTRI